MTRVAPLTAARKLAFAALAVVVAVGGLELTARVVLRLPPATTAGDGDGWVDRLSRDLTAVPTGPSLYVADPELLWRLRPEQSMVLPNAVYETRSTPLSWHLTINPEGHRGAIYPRTGAGPVVVTVGDSCTFGFRVDDDQTYPAQLESWLRANGLPTATVVNLGVPGYTSFQGRRVLSALLARQTPAAVVIAFGANDLEADRLTDVDKQRRLGRASLQLLHFAERLASVRLARQLAGGAARTEPAAATAPRTRRVPIPEFAANLSAMIAEAQAAGALVVVADQVFIGPQLRYTIERVATAGGAPFVDAREVLREGLARLRSEPDLLAEASRIDRFWEAEVISFRHFYYSEEYYKELFADPVRRDLLRYLMVEPLHANGLGNRLIAQTIGARLLQAGLMAVPASPSPRSGRRAIAPGGRG